MNKYTKTDIKEIESRINSRVCPFCGGNSIIELKYYQNVITHEIISCCCDDFRRIEHEIVAEEHDNQALKKVMSILRI